MRRIFVVLVLLAMMLGLKALKADTVGASDPLTLAGIGFVVLAAFAVAELGASMQLPKVTGYIVSGVVLGPFATNVLTADVVAEMKMFSTLALGLIATTAGLELELKGLRALAKTLSVTILIKIATGLGLVGGVVLGVQLAFGVFPLESTAAAVGVAIVMAALSLGTSPAIALAVLDETRAKGRLAELVLGAAVVKDVVVVVGLAVAVAIAKALTGGGAVGADVLLHVGEELGASALAGAALGGLLIVYLRYVKAEMLLFVAAMVLVVAEVSAALHLELLLVFIVAGMVVRNFSRYEHDLLHPLQTVSLPVFIVFFTIAGASVDLRATAGVLPVAIAVCGARAAGYWLAGRGGGRAGGESAAVRRLAWLGYLPQAGVTLGLMGLAAGQLPELGPHITTLGMAVVAINLLVGPVTLRVALRSAGEIPASEATPTPKADEVVGSPQGDPWDELEAPELRALVRDTMVDGVEAARALVADSIAPWLQERTRRLVDAVRESPDAEHALTEIAGILERLPPDDAPQRADALAALFADRSRRLQSLPTALRVPLETGLKKVSADDTWTAALRKRLATVAAVVRQPGRARQRIVPVRMISRTIIEPALARALEEVANGWYRTEILHLEELRRCALQVRSPGDSAANLEALSREFAARVEADLRDTETRMARALALELGRVGGPTHPASSVRYSRVEPELVRWRTRLRDDASNWSRRRDAAARLVRVTAEVALIEEGLARHLQEQVFAVGEDSFAAVREEAQSQTRRLAGLVEAARSTSTVDDELFDRLRMQATALVPKPAQKRLRAAGARLRRATSSGTVTAIFRDAEIEAAGRETIVYALAGLVDAQRPARCEVLALDIGETVQGYLSAQLAPVVENALGELWATFAMVRETMSNCAGAAEFVLSTASRDSSDEATPSDQLAEQLQHSHEALGDALQSAEQRWRELREGLDRSIADISEHLVAAISQAAGRSSLGSQGADHRRIVVALLAIWGRIASPASVGWQALLRRVRGEVQHGIGRRYRLRAGSERADAADVREFLRETGQGADLPAMYKALFAPEPVRDPRLFVAHREALQEVVRAERIWQSDDSAGNAVLIVGTTGTGKTSLAHVARLKLATRRVLVVPERDQVEDGSLLDYLAKELGCAARPEAIGVALGRSRSAVVVDDLQAWLGLGVEGVEQLDELLNIVVATRASAFWLLAMAREGLEAYELVLPVRPAFAQVVRLEPVAATALDAVVQSRQQLTALELSFPVSWWARVLDRALDRSPRESYVHSLAAASSGNLRRALRGWLRRAHLDSDRTIGMAPIGAEWGLPFLRQLSAAQLAVLALLVRFGRRRTADIAPALSLPPDHVERELRFLVASGLLLERAQWLDVPMTVRDDVASALVEFGALPGAQG